MASQTKNWWKFIPTQTLTWGILHPYHIWT